MERTIIMAMNLYYMSLYFFIYGFLGWCAEVGFAAFKEQRFVNRGFLNGAICPIYGVGVMAVTALLAPFKENLMLLYILSVLLVTFLEGITGWTLDKIFHNKWWDYTDQPFNIGGYICLGFSLVWGVACVAIMVFIHPLIHKLLTLIPHTAGIALITLLGITMFADLYVTASAIFKFNKRLSSMERIAKELHEISDSIGEDIYEGVILAMEKGESSLQKLDKATSDLKAKTQEVSAEWLEKTKEMSTELRERTQEMSAELRKEPRRCPQGCGRKRRKLLTTCSAASLI
ncbi:MAG: putative ABC transporter permease [Muricomes sp.]